jgi:chemotaxis methyl-accepting protein methylase/mannose-6-phosphate isomerase-like protein (cupin superfamily)
MERKTVSYTYSRPLKPSFKGKGVFGYTFGPLKQKDLEVLYVESETGHDVFLISKKVSRTYYILHGNGYFTIDNQKYAVSEGMLVEVPRKVEYSYSGKMVLLVFCTPRWFRGNDTFTKWNPDVVGHDSRYAADGRPWWIRLLGVRILGKSPINAFLRLNQRIWNKMPSALTTVTPVRSYGNALHTVARIQGTRAQAFSTFFFRNRPQLELVRRLLDRKGQSDTLRVAVLGCSAGAEAYSLAWRIKSARPDLRLVLHATDISSEAVEWAENGAYTFEKKNIDRAVHDWMGAGRWVLAEADSPLVGAEVFERMTPAEVEEFFDRSGNTMTVKPWIKEGIKWQVGDARDPGILDTLGLQDIVVANNFLCHMADNDAEECLRNIARLVRPGGYLIVSGIDPDVRTKVARQLGWEPVQELIEEIHDGDPVLRSHWPCEYAGLEPLDKRRQDWRIRYAAVFQLGSGKAVEMAVQPDTASAPQDAH